MIRTLNFDDINPNAIVNAVFQGLLLILAIHLHTVRSFFKLALRCGIYCHLGESSWLILSGHRGRIDHHSRVHNLGKVLEH